MRTAVVDIARTLASDGAYGFEQLVELERLRDQSVRRRPVERGRIDRSRQQRNADTKRKKIPW